MEIVKEKISKLKKIVEESPTDPELIILLKDIKEECDGGIAKKVLGGQCGLYDILVNYLIKHDPIEELMKAAIFEALISLMTG